MSYLIRRATQDDVTRLSELLDDYMRETYHMAWAGNADSLGRDGFGDEFHLTVAEGGAGRELVGFVAVAPAYDLHHCVRGGEVIDLYVRQEHRGRGVAMLLLVAAAGQVHERGGAYLKGGSVDDAGVRRLYRRCAVCLPNGECYISGRASRRLAELSGKTVREVIGGLPTPEWSQQP